MKYRVRHLTEYSYAEPVDLVSHMMHLRPRVLPHQRVAAARIRIGPEPSHASEGIDHFGNLVSWAFIDQAHTSLRVALEAEVEVQFPTPPADDATPAWEQVVAIANAGGAAGYMAAEFTLPSPMVGPIAAARAYAEPSFPAGRPVLAGLRDLTARISRDFTFRPGVTTLATPVARVMERREGVCQDFTHVALAALRALGLPARYVSGYIRTRPRPGSAVRRGADQSHAWVGAWLGPAHGWVDLDPTNNLLVQDEHVVLGWGRDYADISPVRGVILGGGKHSLEVSVDLIPG